MQVEAIASVRRAMVRDAEAIAEIMVRTWQSTYRGIVPDDFLNHLGDDLRGRTERWRAILSRPDPHATFVASGHGALVGYVSGGPDREDPALGELYAIYVLGEAQHLGAGRALAHAMSAHLRRQGFSAMRVWVLSENPSRLFYERLGGIREREKEVEIGGRLLWETAYLWDPIDRLP